MTLQKQANYYTVVHHVSKSNVTFGSCTIAICLANNIIIHRRRTKMLADNTLFIRT